MQFLTGFPGFLGSALVERLLERGDEQITCLVQPAYREEARRRRRSLTEAAGVEAGRVRLVEGDITDPDLGLDDPASLRAATRTVYHLAAVYDLGVEHRLAERVNVDGTEHVLAFAERAGVDRLHYVSTCYVSGRHDGAFTHADLDVGQSFNNHYEATKFAAEVAVQERMAAGLPATIYRPAIAVGDSQIGATQKYDGPYYLLALLRRQPRIAVAPAPAKPTTMNVVPRDFVVDAVAALSARADTVGEVYQLCNPHRRRSSASCARSGERPDRPSSLCAGPRDARRRCWTDSRASPSDTASNRQRCRISPTRRPTPTRTPAARCLGPESPARCSRATPTGWSPTPASTPGSTTVRWCERLSSSGNCRFVGFRRKASGTHRK